MTPDSIREASHGIPSNLPCRHFRAGAVAWHEFAQTTRSSGGSLLTLWGADDRDRYSRYRIYAAYLQAEGIAVVEHAMDGHTKPTCPSLEEIYLRLTKEDGQ